MTCMSLTGTALRGHTSCIVQSHLGISNSVILYSYNNWLLLIRVFILRPKDFEDAALFLHLGLASTLKILQENGILRKRRLCVLVWKESASIHDAVNIIRIFPARVFLKHKSKLTGDWRVLISPAYCKRKRFSALSEWNAVFNFLWRNVDVN